MINRFAKRPRVFAAALLAAVALSACESTTEPPMPGSISGSVTIDGVGAGDIAVGLTGAASSSTTTDASGAFSFADIDPGTYTVMISGTDTELVTFEQSSFSVELGSAGAETVAFVGSPTGVQRVLVYAYYGIDGTKPGVAPAPGVQVDLYPTQFDRDSGSNRLDRTTTNGSGVATFTFNRANDQNETGGATDNTVYTRVSSSPANHAIQADGQQTVSYQGHEVVKPAADTVDVLNGDVTVEFRVQTIQTSYDGPEGSALLKPNWVSRSYVDTAGGPLDMHSTGFDGVARFFLDAPVSNLPITVYFRLDGSQSSDAGNIWTQTPEPTSLASGPGRFMTYVHDGTQPPGTADLGIQRVEYITQALFVPLHHEVDNADATPVFTRDVDDWEGAPAIFVEALAGDQVTVLESAFASSTGAVVWNGPNHPAAVLRANLIAQDIVFVRASSTNPDISIVTPTIYQVGQAGGGSVGTFGPGAGGFRHSARLCPLAADTVILNCSAFAYKYNTTTVRGTITNGGGSAVPNMDVELYRCTPPDTANCSRDGSPVSTTTNASGVYSFIQNLEDIYEVVPNAASAGFSSVSPAGGSPVVVTSGDQDVQTKDFTAN